MVYNNFLGVVGGSQLFLGMVAIIRRGSCNNFLGVVGGS